MREILVAGFLMIASSQFAHAQASPLGDWSRGDGKAIVRVAPCGDALCAVNTWIAAGTPDEHVGDRLIMRVKKDSDTRYTGTASDPQRGMNFDMTIEVADRTMTTRGCLLWVLCKDMGWSRLEAARK